MALPSRRCRERNLWRRRRRCRHRWRSGALWTCTATRRWRWPPKRAPWRLCNCCSRLGCVESRAPHPWPHIPGPTSLAPHPNSHAPAAPRDGVIPRDTPILPTHPIICTLPFLPSHTAIAPRPPPPHAAAPNIYAGARDWQGWVLEGLRAMSTHRTGNSTSQTSMRRMHCRQNSL